MFRTDLLKDRRILITGVSSELGGRLAQALEDELMKVTPELIQKTAQDYLRPTNRTILQLKTAK